MTARKAKKPADADAGINRRGRRYFETVLQTLHGLFPSNFVKSVRPLVDRHDRTIELWKTRDRAPDAEAVLALMTGEYGEHFVLAILKTVPHRWAEDWRNAHELVVLEREEETVKRRKRAILLRSAGA